MKVTPDELVRISEPEDLSSLEMAELRALRDTFAEVENGLSYVRRVVQGRLDTITVEIDRRSGDVGHEVDLIRILPDVLAGNVRGPGLPRPTRDLEPPEWTAEMLVELDEMFTPRQLAAVEELPLEQLREGAERVAAYESDVSRARGDIHRRIDRIQEELISRYRQGASVDDLLG